MTLPRLTAATHLCSRLVVRTSAASSRHLRTQPDHRHASCTSGTVWSSAQSSHWTTAELSTQQQLTKSNSFINDLKYTSDDGKDQVASTDTDKADVQSTFFSTVYVKEPQLYNDVVMHDSSAIGYKDMLTINVGDILKRLSDLNIYKSAGPGNLFPRILYEIRNEIAFPLLKIF